MERTVRIENMLLRLSEHLEPQVEDTYANAFRSALGEAITPMTSLIVGGLESSLAPGWYPDGGSSKRQWDGSSWVSNDTPVQASQTDIAVGTGPQDEEEPAGPRLHLEQLSVGLFLQAGCVTVVAVVLVVPFLGYIFGTTFSDSTVKILMWVIGIPFFLALTIGQLFVNPDEIKCPRCGKRFRKGYTTCRQCGYTQPA